jgi:Aspartyl protease
MVILPTGHAAVELDVAGQTSTFIIDTGAGLQGVSQAWAQRMNLPRLPGEISGTGSGGTFHTYAVTMPAMSIAGYTIQQAWAIVLPIPAGTPFDGVIGADFLKDFVVSMDWEAKVLRLQSHERFVPPLDAVAIPFELRGRFHQIAIQANLAGRTGWCQLDTGAFNAVTVLRPSVEAFGWRDAFSPHVRTVTGFGAGGTSDGREYGDFVRLPTVQIGSFTLNQVITDLSLAQQGFFSTDAFMCNLG